MTPFVQAVTEIELYGFTLIPDVVKQDEIDALREALKRCADTAGKPDYVNRNGTSLVVSDTRPRFLQVIDHPVVLPVLGHFLDTTMILGLSSRIVLGQCWHGGGTHERSRPLRVVRPLPQIHAHVPAGPPRRFSRGMVRQAVPLSEGVVAHASRSRRAARFRSTSGVSDYANRPLPRMKSRLCSNPGGMLA